MASVRRAVLTLPPDRLRLLEQLGFQGYHEEGLRRHIREELRTDDCTKLTAILDDFTSRNLHFGRAINAKAIRLLHH